jgi:hypothetical protein
MYAGKEEAGLPVHLVLIGDLMLVSVLVNHLGGRSQGLSFLGKVTYAELISKIGRKFLVPECLPRIIRLNV